MYLANNDFIKISFDDYFFKNFNDIYLSPNKNMIYYDKSHLNYTYKIIEDEIEYIFNGFFKDDYLIITFDSYNSKININIENKNIIVIKLDWILKKLIDNTEVWALDNKKFINYNTTAMIVPIRNKLFNITNTNIDEYLRLTLYTTMKIVINNTNTIKNTKKIDLKKAIFSLFSITNEEF